MIVHWQNQVSAFVGGHRYFTVGVFRHLPQHVGVTSTAPVAPFDGGVALPTLVFGGGVDAPTLVFGGGVAPPTIVEGGGADEPSFD